METSANQPPETRAGSSVRHISQRLVSGGSSETAKGQEPVGWLVRQCPQGRVLQA